MMKLSPDKKSLFLIFLLLSSFLCFSICFVPAVFGEDENWLDGWFYRKFHVIGGCVGAGPDYQVCVTVEYGSGSDLGDVVYVDGKCRSDFGDIRFTGGDGETLLDYWMSESVDSSYAMFWVKVADDLSSDVTLFVYYGNDAASDASNGDETFLLFNDFSSSVGFTSFPYDLSPWGTVDGTSSETFSVSSGVLEMTQGVSRSHMMALSSLGHDDVAVSVKINFGVVENIEEIGLVARHSVTGSNLNQYFLRAIHRTVDNTYGLELIGSSGGNEYPLFPFWEFNHLDSTWYTLDFRLYDNLLTVYQDGMLAFNVTNNDVVSGDSIGLMNGYTLDVTHYFDDFFVRKYVNPEPSHGTWSEEQVTFSPVTSGLTIFDMDATDNLYAQKKFYPVQLVVGDGDGVSNIDYAEFSIMQESALRASFRFDENTKTFSIESGASSWDLDSENCSYEVSGKTITLLFMISPKFNAIEESDLDISTLVVDEHGESTSQRVRTDYFDVVTSLVVTEFACDDNRGDIGQPLEFSGRVFYVDDPSSDSVSVNYPPASAFEAVYVCDSRGVDQGNDKTVVNGTFFVTFSAQSSVDLEAYHPSIEMKDSGRIDLTETPTDNFITDRIKISNLGVKDSRINVDDVAEIYATAEYEYDGQSLGSDDVLTIGSVDLIWNGTCFVGTETKSSVQQKVYNEGESKEKTYGITAFNMDSHSVSVVWDRLNVQFTVNDNLVTINTPARFTVKILREYDDSPVQSYTYTIKREGLDISNTYSTSQFTDVSNLEETRIYNLISAVDSTYGLTAFTVPSSISVAWTAGFDPFQIVIIGTLVAVGVVGLLYLWKRKKS